MSSYKAIIFDLGNVVFRISFGKMFETWARELNLDARRLSRDFAFDEEYARFEKDLISAAEYERHAAALLGVKFEKGVFEKGWNSIYEEVVPGVPELLKRLKDRYRLTALTNTNALHYPVWREKYKSVLAEFEKVFLSFRLKARKPEPGAYAAAAEYLNASPQEIIFMDDSPENVAAAQQFGMAGVTVSSFMGMTDSLKEHGIKL